MDFFENYQQYNSKSEANAKEQAEKCEEPIKIFKQHITHFEKLLNLATLNLSNTFICVC
jgi:hypothetical protein